MLSMKGSQRYPTDTQEVYSMMCLISRSSYNLLSWFEFQEQKQEIGKFQDTRKNIKNKTRINLATIKEQDRLMPLEIHPRDLVTPAYQRQQQKLSSTQEREYQREKNDKGRSSGGSKKSSPALPLVCGQCLRQSRILGLYNVLVAPQFKLKIFLLNWYQQMLSLSLLVYAKKFYQQRAATIERIFCSRLYNQSCYIGRA
ncbi:unnamed protein product [Paramecium octaurelia]|uniref:Uncharacterized protein n=1 Tax=Paramecium octaurelia TaxID=43137 RepID=A0A8S1YR52_PAROT|nr:unnamed protein product [Paramecium octaurelia]